MRLTSIDIGTNTVLMLIADVNDDGQIETLRDDIAFPRLGEGVEQRGTIAPSAVARAVDVLKKYKEFSNAFASSKILACGTNALRVARNRDGVLKRILDETALNVEVLSGEDEARWTFLGAVAHLPPPAEKFVVIDIGGGSTEVVRGSLRLIESQSSLPLGCVGLTEMYLSRLPPQEGAVERARAHIQSRLALLTGISPRNDRLIGVAGTATTLAALHLNVSEFDRERIDGCTLSLSDIESIFESLRKRSLREMLASAIISPGRADVLLAGILILLEFMRRFSYREITVGCRGLRYGLLLRELQRLKARVF
jgi:exopolyphosphatase/guanosine-5'-triphosphate,3'-diphosphate pyrophosphatase